MIYPKFCTLSDLTKFCFTAQYDRFDKILIQTQNDENEAARDQGSNQQAVTTK